MNIEVDNLADGAIIELLNSHLQEMHKYSPPESVHALDVNKLKDENITFWGARSNGKLAACGALKEIALGCGEIKSMKTNQQFLRQGFAAKLLKAIISEARRRSYTELKLETGSHESFTASIKLYEKFGFVECGPYGDYTADPHSKFFVKTLK